MAKLRGKTGVQLSLKGGIRPAVPVLSLPGFYCRLHGAFLAEKILAFGRLTT